MLPDGVTFPKLPDKYHSALTACLEAIFERYDVLAVVASGTAVRGAPDRRSDLDIQVLHRGTFRQRVQLFFEAVPCEIFVNPPSRVARYFAEERKGRRPCTAHMFASGWILYDPEGVASAMSELARADLADQPAVPDPVALQVLRYGPATMFEDAEDLIAREPAGALLLLGHAVYELAKCRLEAEQGWIPRHKDFLPALRELDPEAARLVAASGTGDLADRFRAARQLCLHVTGSDGFFEWASAREDV